MLFWLFRPFLRTGVRGAGREPKTGGGGVRNTSGMDSWHSSLAKDTAFPLSGVIQPQPLANVPLVPRNYANMRVSGNEGQIARISHPLSMVGSTLVSHLEGLSPRDRGPRCAPDWCLRPACRRTS